MSCYNDKCKITCLVDSCNTTSIYDPEDLQKARAYHRHENPNKEKTEPASVRFWNNDWLWAHGPHMTPPGEKYNHVCPWCDTETAVHKTNVLQLLTHHLTGNCKYPNPFNPKPSAIGVEIPVSEEKKQDIEGNLQGMSQVLFFLMQAQQLFSAGSSDYIVEPLLRVAKLKELEKQLLKQSLKTDLFIMPYSLYSDDGLRSMKRKIKRKANVNQFEGTMTFYKQVGDTVNPDTRSTPKITSTSSLALLNGVNFPATFSTTPLLPDRPTPASRQSPTKNTPEPDTRSATERRSDPYRNLRVQIEQIGNGITTTDAEADSGPRKRQRDSLSSPDKTEENDPPMDGFRLVKRQHVAKKIPRQKEVPVMVRNQYGPLSGDEMDTAHATDTCSSDSDSEPEEESKRNPRHKSAKAQTQTKGKGKQTPKLKEPPGPQVPRKAAPPPPIILHCTLESRSEDFFSKLQKKLTSKLTLFARNKTTHIEVKNMVDYDIVVAALSKLPYHTYQTRAEQSRRFVLKGVSTHIRDNALRNTLTDLGLDKITRVVRMTSRRQESKGEPLLSVLVSFDGPMTLPVLREKASFLGLHSVTWSHYKGTGAPPVCGRCCAVGHTEATCNRPHCCGVCAKEHPVQECLDKRKSGEVVEVCCANCGEEHLATWKGCKAVQNWKKRQDKKRAPPPPPPRYRDAPPHQGNAWSERSQGRNPQGPSTQHNQKQPIPAPRQRNNTQNNKNAQNPPGSSRDTAEDIKTFLSSLGGITGAGRTCDPHVYLSALTEFIHALNSRETSKIIYATNAFMNAVL